jgi:ribosomal protein S12 methylthiotransferase accessory factor
MDNHAIQGSKEHSIGLIGQGAVYQNVKRRIESRYRIIPLARESSSQQFATCGIVVYCSDAWFPKTLQEINCRCLQSDVALLPVYTQFGEGIIGPCIVPQEKGCTSCAELRQLGATSSEAERELLHQYLYEEREPIVSQPWLSSFSLEILAVLVGEEITTYFQRPSQIRTGCALLSVSLETLECRRHAFLPLSSCPDCGELPKDTAEMAVITLQSCPKVDVFTYRIQQPEANTERILSTYVDERMGLVYSLTAENKNSLPIASSLLSFEPQDGEGTIGTGCTLRPEQSKIVSLFEAIERYAGMRPRSKRTTVRASYHQLVQQAQQALDPTTLGLHSPEQYEQHKQNHSCSHLVPYSHDLLCNWVWGYSFQHQSPILVPEHSTYYSIPKSKENPAFVYETSNGCALGDCLEEAIFHGIMEVVERDAFLLTWYAQLRLPRLYLLSVTDPTIRLLVEHLEYHSGYTIHVLNATLDHAIPCLCLLGVDEQNREGMPKAHVVAGSHPHPEQALLRALRELTTSLDLPPQSYQQRRTEALEMLTNASLVKTMHDHPLVYYLPEAFDRLNFFYRTQQQQTFQEAFGDFYHYPPAHMDLRDDLEDLISYYLKRGIDIIVVDQTAPEHTLCGLRCVKVLMPGMLPMTFGQHNRRIRGFERLHQLPFTLGYRTHPLTEAEINPHPHPFY